MLLDGQVKKKNKKPKKKNKGISHVCHAGIDNSGHKCGINVCLRLMTI